MARGRFCAITLSTILAASTAAACEGERRPDPFDTPDVATSRPGDDPPSDEPTSDVQVETFSLSSRDDLIDHLRDTGWTEAVVFPGADPKRLELWTGDGHWHAQTTYRFAGVRVRVTQAGFEGLPPGRLVRIRGEYGVRSDGGLYWLEHGFTLAISPNAAMIARRLEWVALR